MAIFHFGLDHEATCYVVTPTAVGEVAATLHVLEVAGDGDKWFLHLCHIPVHWSICLGLGLIFRASAKSQALSVESVEEKKESYQ